MGLVVRVQGPDVAPVDGRVRSLARNVIGLEVVGEHVHPVDQRGQDVAPEIMVALLAGGVGVQLAQQGAGREDVVAHGGEDLVRVARDGGRVASLLVEGDDAAVARGLDHPEVAREAPVHRDGGHRDLGALLLVELDHARDVHPVDVVGPEDRHQVRIRLLDEIGVLVDGVRGAAVPGLARRAHLGRHRDDELLLEQPTELPAVREVLQQRLALELREDVDGVDARVDEVAEDEVDDAVLAPERYRRLGALLGQRKQARAFAAGQDDAEDPESHRTAAASLPSPRRALGPLTLPSPQRGEGGREGGSGDGGAGLLRRRSPSRGSPR